ncbi:MAG: triose-phosphate isomerase [Candidatus Saganbacteria bacterium]|nr:triose-phosphate isomerase [Candidatus Saganbacteria bacterium]
MAIGKVNIVASNTKFRQPLRTPDGFKNYTMGLVQAMTLLDSVDVRVFGHQSVLFDTIIKSLNGVLELIESNTPVIGPQNMHWTDDGSFTDAPPSVKDWLAIGYKHIMLGHSELRVYFGETDERVAQKTILALQNGLHPTICVGQDPKEEAEGKGMDALNRQITEGILPALDRYSDSEDTRLDVAWEPLAAIAGFAKLWNLEAVPPTDEDIQLAHEGIKNIFSDKGYPKTAETLRILYGGSAKPTNAEQLLRLPYVNGLLIGTASWDIENMIKMIEIADRLAKEPS